MQPLPAMETSQYEWNILNGTENNKLKQLAGHYALRK
jgi:hypothetical protein